jgi:hypothetical protein
MLMMMRRPEFLMMPTPRRPAPPQKSGPIGLYITTGLSSRIFGKEAW